MANLDQLQLLLDEVGLASCVTDVNLSIIQALPGVKRPDPLTDQEQQQVELIMKRLNDIGEVRKQALMGRKESQTGHLLEMFFLH